MTESLFDLKEKVVLFIGAVFPEPESSAAGTRIMQLIDLFKSNECIIHFATDADNLEYSINLKEEDIQVESIQLNDSSFNDFLLRINPEIVVFDRFMTEEKFGWRVIETVPKALRILDMEDFHGLRLARQKAVENGRLAKEANLNQPATFREIASIFRCDLSLVISSFELDILEREIGIPKRLLHYLPLFAKPSADNISLNSFHERKNFVSIGNFRHPPNLDSVLQLKHEIWPQIRHAIPHAELHIYGAYENSIISTLNKPSEGFVIKGRAKNVDETLSQYRVMLAPLRFGAGLKGKLIDAMRNETPSITTNIGAEGMLHEEQWAGFICDDLDDFSDKAIFLYQSQVDWEKFSAISSHILKKHFLQGDFEREFIDLIKYTISNLQFSRNGNYIGQMLQLQELNATKYMSKWIEEKNKKLN
ncbi:MAG: glycosyltransferase [Bacteroidia bacterium]